MTDLGSQMDRLERGYLGQLLRPFFDAPLIWQRAILLALFVIVVAVELLG